MPRSGFEVAPPCYQLVGSSEEKIRLRRTKPRAMFWLCRDKSGLGTKSAANLETTGERKARQGSCFSVWAGTILDSALNPNVCGTPGSTSFNTFEARGCYFVSFNISVWYL
jgi:hypothetical protein